MSESSSSLPVRANLEWLRKRSKERLAEMRARDPGATLGAAQLALAREYGFPSWRKLKAHVDQVHEALPKLPPGAPEVEPNDPELARLLGAIDAGEMPVITELLGRRPELARGHGADGRTPLHAAAQCNDNRLAVFLLAHGADPDATYGQSGHTPLSWAVTCQSMAFAGTLARLGVRPDLFCAAGMGSLEHVRAWFDESSRILLPNAARSGSTRIAADGSRLPCPPETPREQVSDALYIACRNGHDAVVRFLLGKDPDLSFRAYMGATPLHWAHFGGSRTVIGLLEQAGADPDARDDSLHATPRAFGICVPASWGFLDRVRHRLADDPSLANLMDGRTGPLHQAARQGHVDVARLLLETGADPAIRDGDGKTPEDLAGESGHAGVVELLRAHSPGQ